MDLVSWHEADYRGCVPLHDKVHMRACERFLLCAIYLSCWGSFQRGGELLPAGSPRVEDVKVFGAIALHHRVPERERIRHISTKIACLQQ